LGSARPAVFRSSTYVFSSPEAAERAFAVALGKLKPKEGESVDLIYSRLSHPNAEICEDQIVPLEPGAKAAAVFNSGMAAISTMFISFCQPGSKFVYTTPLYGGTHHLIHQILAPHHLNGIAVPAGETAKLEETIRDCEDLRLVFIETPANPTLKMSDISAAVLAAKRHKNRPIVAVDNTFLGPAFQHPLALGADLSVYSGTKFLSGFSDMLAGVIMGSKEHIAQLQGTRAILGNILQPDECWLLGTRIPLVTLKMNRQSKNAQRIAEKLSSEKKLKKIYYPSLFAEAEQIRIRNAQCRFPGSIFSLELQDGKQAAFEVLRRLKIFKNAVSLGGVESLACHPATTTHSEMNADQLLEAGVTPGMIRFSVGVEDWQDLLQDIRQALDFSN
jgi:cystathionine beta-lyase/cystathionine gamma-synthase